MRSGYLPARTNGLSETPTTYRAKLWHGFLTCHMNVRQCLPGRYHSGAVGVSVFPSHQIGFSFRHKLARITLVLGLTTTERQSLFAAEFVNTSIRGPCGSGTTERQPESESTPNRSIIRACVLTKFLSFRCFFPQF